MRDELMALADEVAELDGSHYHIELRIENALGIAKFERDPMIGFGDADYHRIPAKNYTASLDAAITLLPDGHKHWNVGGSPRKGFAGAGLYGATIDDQFYGEARTAALALTAAALRARAQEADQR